MQQIQGVSILKNLDKCNNFFLKTAKYTVLLHCCAVLQLHIWSNVLRFFVLQCCSCICGLKFCAFFMMPLQPQGLYSFFIHSSALIMSTHNSTEKLTPSRKCKSLTLLQKAKIIEESKKPGFNRSKAKKSGEANSASYYWSTKIKIVKTVVTILYNNSNTHCSTDLTIQ